MTTFLSDAEVMLAAKGAGATSVARVWVKTFQPRFVGLVSSGHKNRTIRPHPRRPQDMPKIGDMIDCRAWTGRPYWSKQCKLVIGRLTRLSSVRLTMNTTIPGAPFMQVAVDNRLLGNSKPAHELTRFAQADGFTDWADMQEWFVAEHKLPFDGLLWEWEVIK